jgi:RNA polymerase-binding transcription factor DksA
MATKPAKKTAAKKAAPSKKVAPRAKKAAPARATATRKAAPARKATPAGKAPQAKKAAPAKKAPVAKKTAPPRKAPPAKKAPPARKVAPAKAVAPARKVAPKGPVVLDKFLEGQRASLLEERERLLRHSLALKAEADSLAADREAGDTQFDDESGEGDTLAVERERDLVLSAQAQQTVAEIDHALAKLLDGTYGICEVSGQPIPKERLRAIPWARERVEFKATGFIR